MKPFPPRDPLQEQLRGLEAAWESHNNGHNRLKQPDATRLAEEISELRNQIFLNRKLR